MKIFVLAAFETEIYPIVHAFHLKEKALFGFSKRWRGDQFDLVQTNIGKVDAAATAQHLIDIEDPDWIINVGLCGGFAKKVAIGDLVIPTAAIQYDMDLTKLGYPLGQIFGLKMTSFPLESIPLKTISYKTGICLSADKLLSDKEEGTRLYNLFHPSIVDMELGAIAHVCYLNKTKLSSLKCPVDIVEKENVQTFKIRADMGMHNLISALKESLDYLVDRQLS